MIIKFVLDEDFKAILRYLCESHNFVLKINGFNIRLQIYKNIYEYKLRCRENMLINLLQCFPIVISLENAFYYTKSKQICTILKGIVSF